jgi:hypothetical protein
MPSHSSGVREGLLHDPDRASTADDRVLDACDYRDSTYEIVRRLGRAVGRCSCFIEPGRDVQ